MAKQERWTAAEYKAHHEKKSGGRLNADRLKFGNIPQTIDGIYFQSTKEAEYYGFLKLRVKAGNITRFDCQVNYKLIVNGVLVTTYRADFVLYYPDGRVVVVDVKGDATEGLETFVIKKNLMQAIHGIKIQIVK